MALTTASMLMVATKSGSAFPSHARRRRIVVLCVYRCCALFVYV